MSISHREKRENLPQVNALTPLVDGSLAQLSRLLKKEYKSSEKEEYVQALFSWWVETKALLRLYIVQKNRIERTLATFLRTPHLSDEQLQAIGKNIKSNMREITNYCFPPSGNIDVARQLENILDEIYYYSEYYFNLNPPEHPYLRDGKPPKLNFGLDEEDAWDNLR